VVCSSFSEREFSYVILIYDGGYPADFDIRKSTGDGFFYFLGSAGL
jgi:hypothetical protein